MRKGGPDNKWKVSPLQVNISGSHKTPEQRCSRRKQRRQEETEVPADSDITHGGTEEIIKTAIVPKKRL